MSKKKAKLNIVEMQVSELIEKKAHYNPREITAEQKNGLRKSIEQFGYVQNIIYNTQTERIVSGHQRLDLLKEDGYETVEVHCVDMNEEEEKKLNILMNSQTIAGNFTDSLNEMLVEIMDNDTELFDVTNMQLLFQDELKDKEENGKDEQSKDIIKGMDLAPYESYDAILVVFKRRDDFMFISSKLGLGEKRVISSPSVKNKKLGYTRCVDGKDIIKLLNDGVEVQEEADELRINL